MATHLTWLWLLFLALAAAPMTECQKNGESGEIDSELLVGAATLSKTKRFESRTLPANNGLHCVSFYTLLSDLPLVGLTIKFLDTDNGKILRQVKAKNDVLKSKEYVLHYFNAREMNRKFKIALELTDIRDPKIKLYIDRLEITQGACPLKEGSCDFEASWCDLRNDNQNKWTRIKATNVGDDLKKFSPAVDSTIGSESGSYLRVQVNKQKGKASVVSKIANSTNSCLTFAYSIYGAGSLVVTKGSKGKPLATYKQESDTGSEPQPKWYGGRSVFSSKGNEPYEIMISAKPSDDGSDTWISLDDIEIHPRACSYVPAKPTEPSSKDMKYIESATCTFDELCTDNGTHVVNTDSDLVWSWQNGKSISGFPKFDKIEASPYGYFLYAKVPESAMSSKSNTQIFGDEFTVNHTWAKSMCISFWYFMHGPQVPRLSVHIVSSDSSDEVVWSKQGNQGPAWNQGFAHFSMLWHKTWHRTMKVMFQVDATEPGSVALDDIKVLDQQCPVTEEVCDFESSYACGYTQDGWSLSNVGDKTGMAYDHTTGFDDEEPLMREQPGTYAYIDTDHMSDGPDFVSPLYAPTAGRCLKFWYHIENKKKSAKPRGQLRVYRRTEEGDSYMYNIFSDSGEDEGWISAEMNMASGTYFHLVFTASGSDSFINLDDIQFSKSSCKDSYGCDFEQGFCSWRNFNGKNSSWDLAWQITSGHLEDGPAKDVSLNSMFGHYIYVVTSDPSDAGKKAVLASQEMNVGGCLTFYRAAVGTGYGPLTLDLYTKDNPSAVNVVTLSHGKASGDWVKTTVPSDKAFPLGDDPQDMWFRLSTVLGNVTGSGWAVDQIEIDEDECSEIVDDDTLMVSCRESDGDVQIKRSQECNFISDCPNGEDEKECGDCTFGYGKGWCRWTDVSMGEIEWTSSLEVDQDYIQGIPDRPKDSMEKKKGEFLVVAHTDASFPGPMIADLETDFTLGPTPATCQLHFSFYRTASTFGSDTHLLSVVIRQAGEETVIYHDDFFTERWSSVTLDIGSIKSPFKLAILGHKKFGGQFEGQIAIDDIEMRNCEFPPIWPTCSGDHRCKRGSCVPHSRVCDFTDDCGDNSDEENCDSALYVLRTDFEEGFGDWNVSMSESSNAEYTWVIQDGVKGQQTDADPGRDHTLGTLHGHYAILKTQTAGRLLSPVLMSPSDTKQCHLRMYFNLKTDGFRAIGQAYQALSVYIRTTQLGPETMVFNRFTDHGHDWIRADILMDDLHEPFQIIIEAAGSAVMAVDDISMYGCMMSYKALPLGTPQPTLAPKCSFWEFQCGDGTCINAALQCDTKKDCPDASDEKDCGTCDFEKGLCGWNDVSLGVFSWRLRATTQVTLPQVDYTYQTKKKGHFVQLNTHSAGVDQGPALLYSSPLTVTDPDCQMSLSFYTSSDYYDLDLIVGLQKISTVEPDEFIQLQTLGRTEIKMDEWVRLTYYIGYLDRTGAKIVIMHPFKRFEDSSFSIAIDDVKFENCSPGSVTKSLQNDTSALDCSFDSTFCDYHPTYYELDGGFTWSLTAAIGHHNGQKTHVAQTGAWTGAEDKRMAVLTSNWIEPTDTEMCLSFWYLTFGTTLTVNLHDILKDERPRSIFNHHSYEYQWHLGRAQIPASEESFRIAFVASTGRYSEVLQLSDVKITKGQCAPKAMCDFEWGQCEYTSTKGGVWLRSESNLYLYSEGDEPKWDHTNPTTSGHYMYATQQEGTRQAKTTGLVSPIHRQDPNSDSCVYFWYMLYGEDAGDLKVKIKRQGSKVAASLIETQADITRKVWRQGRATIPKDIGDYRIIFEAVPKAGKFGTIAVDDIQFSVGGACPSPGTCTFDHDLCGYTTYNIDGLDDVEDPARWIRVVSDHPASRYGPSEDHNKDFKNGGFAFADPFIFSLRNLGHQAFMASPYIPATQEGHVSFWFYFDGPAVGMLRVNISDTLYLTITSKSKEWQHRTFDYKSDKPHHLIFEATRDSNTEAALAIDDIVISRGHSVPWVPHSLVPATTLAPKPDQNPDAPVPGSGSATDPDKTNCHMYCKHFKTCRLTSDNKVDCECQEGYKGNRCDRPVPQEPAGSPEDISPSRRSEDGADSPSSGGSNTGLIIGIAVGVIGLIVLAIVVFIVLVRTKKVQAPEFLQRHIPLMTPAEQQRGSSNPSYQYTNNPDSADGIINPVYGEAERGESDI